MASTACRESGGDVIWNVVRWDHDRKGLYVRGQDSSTSSEPRFFLLQDAETGLDKTALGIIRIQNKPQQRYYATVEVLDRDARAVQAVFRLLVEPREVIQEAAAILLVAFCAKGSEVSEWRISRVVREGAGWEAVIEAALDARSVWVREAASVLLCEPQAGQFWERVVRGLEDPSERVRREVVRAIARSERADAAGLVERRLGDAAPTVRHVAVFCLGQLRARESVPRLLEMLKDDDLSVAGTVASSLGSIGDPSAFDGLRAAVQRGIPSAALALGRLADDRALSILLKLLEQPDRVGYMRGTALAGLMNLAHPDSVPALIQILEDPREQETVGGQAARALAQVEERTKDERARAWLDAALSRESSTGNVVAAGLAVFGGTWAEKARCYQDEFDD